LNKAGYKEDSQELLTLVDELIDDLTGKLDTVSNEIKAKSKFSSPPVG
jgi:hypothetical protein